MTLSRTNVATLLRMMSDEKTTPLGNLEKADLRSASYSEVQAQSSSENHGALKSQILEWKRPESPGPVTGGGRALSDAMH